MDIQLGITHQITDSNKHDLGQFQVETAEGNRLLGRFRPGPDFATVEPLFRDFEELVNDQILSLTDEAQDRIHELGIQFDDGTLLTDVQFYSNGAASCRLAAERNGKH